MFPCMIYLLPDIIRVKKTMFPWGNKENWLIFCRIHMTFEKRHGFYKKQPLFLNIESVFDENLDKNKFPCMIYFLPDRI